MNVFLNLIDIDLVSSNLKIIVETEVWNQIQIDLNLVIIKWKYLKLLFKIIFAISERRSTFANLSCYLYFWIHQIVS